MSTLYELTQDLQEMDQLLEDLKDDESATQTIEMIKSEIESQLDSKSTDLIKYIRTLDLEMQTIETEEKRLKELKNSKKKKIDNLKSFIMSVMQTNDMKRITTSIGNITLRSNPESVLVENENDIPKHFKKIETKETIDKKAIKAAIQSGTEVKGCKLIRTQSVVLPK